MDQQTQSALSEGDQAHYWNMLVSSLRKSLAGPSWLLVACYKLIDHFEPSANQIRQAVLLIYEGGSHLKIGF